MYEKYYNLGVYYAIKTAGIPSLGRLSTATRSTNNAVNEAAETSDQSKNKYLSMATNAAKGMAKGYVQSIVDPTIPKKESIKDKIINVAGDVGTVAAGGSLAFPAATARSLQRYVGAENTANKVVRNLQRGDKTSRRAAANYLAARYNAKARGF